MFDMKIENNRVKEELERDMKHLLEQKAELKREVRVGKEAERKLKEKERELEAVMVAWLGSKKNNMSRIFLISKEED